MFVLTNRQDRQQSESLEPIKSRLRKRTGTSIAILFALVMLILILCGSSLQGQNVSDPLKAGFLNPPESARPRVWWHWMNGNITKEGIRLDLEWMHRVGLGGFQTFDAQLSTPQVVKKRLVYMTPEWKDAFRYATTLADQLGLEEGIASSPGWSETGGPWVPPSEAMKKYVWSETAVEGPEPFRGVLMHPPTSSGPFQDLDIGGGKPGNERKSPRFYADSAVVAFKVPQRDAPIESLNPKITWSGGTPDLAALTDGKLSTETTLLEAPPGQNAWIQYAFQNPTTIRSLTIAMGQKGRHEDAGIVMEKSDDGQSFAPIVEVPKGGSAEHTLSFPAVTAKFFRVVFRAPPASAFGNVEKSSPPQSLKEVHIAELELHPEARVNRFEDKAAFEWPSILAPEPYDCATSPISPSDAISKSDVIDLTGRMQADGTLDWTPPAGRWVILRFGYSLLGITNHPATPEATGLEVDKLNAHYVKNYMDNYLDSFKGAVGPALMGSHGIQYVVTDSWEAGPQNWTDNMIQEFTRRRGYDPTPWLPVLTGRVVESSEASDRFLWDFRKTIADLTADEHYGQVEASLKEHGIGHYGESHEAGRAFIADGMEVKKLDDIPMGAMWVQKPGVNNPTYDYNADDRESASVAHIYGQNIAAAESMTSCDSSTAWAWSPATLKPTADQEFLNGINRIVIHESAHQPLVNKAPGVTLGPCGQFFNRNETWAEEAKPWIDYLARTSYLLKQGRFAADIVYFYGEDSNLTRLFGSKSPDIPAGFEFDYINADGLIHELHVQNGRITTNSGMSYRVLALDPYSRHMSLPVLHAISDLVKRGAVLVGEKPMDDPSLADDQAEFHMLADKLFGNGSGVYEFGAGKVFAGRTISDALNSLGVEPDFSSTGQQGDGQIQFVHRKLPEDDLYFLDNRSNREVNLEASFRVTGRQPELWYAETGETRQSSYQIANGRTNIPLHLEPWGTTFVVFRRPAKSSTLVLPEPMGAELSAVEGAWKVNFTPGLGAPPSIELDRLSSWSDNADQGVKYYSGTGIYTKIVTAQSDWFKEGGHLWIDLGEVRNLAQVSLNGKDLGTVWHAPYRVDVTGALKPGSNTLVVKVTNAWVNRLIGDQQPSSTKYTYADVQPYKADSPLLPSGLLGPVKIIRSSSETGAHIGY